MKATVNNGWRLELAVVQILLGLSVVSKQGHSDLRFALKLKWEARWVYEWLPIVV